MFYFSNEWHNNENKTKKLVHSKNFKSIQILTCFRVPTTNYRNVASSSSFLNFVTKTNNSNNETS